MRKNLLVIFGLVATCVLAACGSKVQDQWDVSDVNNIDVMDENEQRDPLAGLYEKTPLTLGDLSKIDRYKFPKSYTYTILNENGNIIETWEYVYPEFEEDAIPELLPIYKETVNMEVIKSVMDHDRINTTVNVTLENGEIYSIIYIINPDTLKYAGASLYKPTETILYAFNY